MAYKEKNRYKKWAEDNKEHLSTYRREWSRKKKEEDPETFRKEQLVRAKKCYEKDPEKFRNRSAIYRKNNPEKVKNSVSKWSEENKEYRKEYKKKYRKKNKKKITQYRKDNPDKYRAYKANRKTRQTKAGGKLTEKQWVEMCALYNNKCVCCHKRNKLTADHVVPVSKGGTSNIDNIQPLCVSCNSKKGTKSTDYRTGRVK